MLLSLLLLIILDSLERLGGGVAHSDTLCLSPPDWRFWAWAVMVSKRS